MSTAPSHRRLNIAIWLLHFGTALVLAVLIVAMPMGHILFSLPWLAIVGNATIHEWRRGFGAATLAVYLLTTAAVVAAAVAAPIKTTERVLDQTFELPATTLTLGQVDTEQNWEQTHTWLPRHVSIDPPPEAADTPIHFDKQQLTLREFVAAIEQQSNLSDRFSHCGNGSSILYGGDCSFGLHLRDRR